MKYEEKNGKKEEICLQTYNGQKSDRLQGEEQEVCEEYEKSNSIDIN